MADQVWLISCNEGTDEVYNVHLHSGPTLAAAVEELEREWLYIFCPSWDDSGPDRPANYLEELRGFINVSGPYNEARALELEREHNEEHWDAILQDIDTEGWEELGAFRARHSLRDRY